MAVRRSSRDIKGHASTKASRPGSPSISIINDTSSSSVTLGGAEGDAIDVDGEGVDMMDVEGDKGGEDEFEEKLTEARDLVTLADTS